MRFTILLLLLPLTVYSQQKEPDYVVVKGRAQVEIPLEYLQVSIAVSTYGSSYKAANDSNRVLVFSVLDVLKRFGIADSDFQTLNISSYENPVSRDAGRAYAIRYNGVLHLRTPQLYDSLFATLVNLGNVAVSISEFQSTKHAYYRMLAYRKAVDAARAEARLLLKGSHQALGRIIKLIQDNRDLYTKYDDIDKLLSGESALESHSSEVSVAASAALPAPQAFRAHSFTETAEVTVIFAIK